MKTLKLVALLTLMILAFPAIAVEHEGGIRLMVTSPTGEFGDSVDDEGFGIELHYGVRPSPHTTFGIGLNVMNYGSESRKYSLPLVDDFELNTDNNMAGGFLFAQWRPLTGAVQPYVEGRVGLNYLWTESKLEDGDWWDIDEVARETNQDDFATAWGGGGGLLIRLCKGNPVENKPCVYLDAKVTYMNGSAATYLSEGDITLVDDVPVYTPSESETDLTTYQLGVVLTF